VIPTIQPQTRRWVSLTLGAEHIGVSEKTLRRMISQGRIRGYRVGPRLIRVDLNELDALASPIPTAGAGRVA
jgi:excisionase family DNA binding protein